MIDLPPPPSYEHTIEAIVRCEIPRSNIKVTYEDELQSDEITISDIGEVSDEKLRCLKNAVHPFYILSITDEAQRTAFFSFAEREDRPRLKAEAREWLRANGKLDDVPEYDPAIGLSTFASQIENACGLPEKMALTADGSIALSIRPDWITGQSYEKLGEAFQCVTRMFAASNADEYGIRFGFTGNEAIRESGES